MIPVWLMPFSPILFLSTLCLLIPFQLILRSPLVSTVSSPMPFSPKPFAPPLFSLTPFSPTPFIPNSCM